MKRVLKIGIVVDQLLAGGVQLAAIEQVKELNKLGHNATLLILMRKKYPTNFSYLVKRIPHRYLSDSYPLLFRRTLKFPIFSFLSTLHLMSPIFAPRVIKKENYDILVSLGTTTCLTTQAIYRKLKIPYIAIIHDPIVYILEKAYSQTNLRYFFPILKPLGRFFERSFVKDALDTIIISKVHYEYIKNNYNLPPKIIGFGTKTLDKIPKRRGKNLLSFGRWQNEKNPEFLLKLIKNIPLAKLIIAGTWIDQSQLARFKEIIKTENLSDRVSVIPHYSEMELKKLCMQARAFIHPHFEAFGLAALEAAGHGLPIIIPKKSGVTEIFTHGGEGFFPSVVDVTTYKKYITKLFYDKELAYEMGLKGWKIVKEKFSWEANTKKLLDLIHNALTIGEKHKILVLETGHALGVPLAGGDKLMEPMAKRLKDKYAFSIIVSSVGAKHWKYAQLKKEMIILPRNNFDESGKATEVFLAYCIRIWQTYKILKAKVSIKSGFREILYSSTNILPDILPAYFIKNKHPQITWVARVHHLIPPPHKREGFFLVNIASYIMQALALFMIKSKADVTLVLNEQLKKDLQKKGFPKERLRVLGGGIDFEKISQTPMQNVKTFDAVFLGRFHITKGIFDTIPIWKEVTKKLPNVRLAIVGDGPIEIKKMLKQKIKDTHLSKNIIILGYLPYSKLYATMKRSRLFLFLDHEAGWGLAVAEAMACGLPVVGYDNGVLGNVYNSGFRTVQIGNYTRCAKEIINLLQLSDIRLILSNQAKKEAAKHDWAHTSNVFKEILNTIEKSN